jgi:peptidoglycan/xylan/chitin deacetylase (PgdA/CDA1 family)
MASRSDRTVLIVGRLSGPKDQVIRNILAQVPFVRERFPGVRFQVVGGPVTDAHREIQKKHPAVSFEGHQPNLEPYYRKATVVIGAGRVALEAMKYRKPVIAIGERLYVGPLRPSNLEKAKATNFGDCSATESFNWPRLASDITHLLRDSRFREQVAKTGHALLLSDYDMEKVYPVMEGLYHRVLLEKNLSQVHEIPVLMYHQVVQKAPAVSKFNLHVTREDLDRQLRFLKDRGFETVTFQDLMTKRLPRKPILLTFDDGYEDNHKNLLPLLREHRMKAVIYILGDRKAKTNFWDTPKGEAEHPLLKPAQVLEMAQSGLVEFGSHSMRHSRLTLLKPAEVEREVAGSKKALEDFLKKPVVSFAYPYGFLNQEIKESVRRAGYTFGIAVNGGPTRFRDDLFEVRRVHMFPKTSMFEYFKKTSGFYLRYRRLLGKA